MPRRADPDAPPAEDLDFEELCDALCDLLGTPLSTSSLGLRRDSSNAWLPRTWLSRAYDRVRKRQGDTEHCTVGDWSRRRILVATLNRIGADVEATLAAEHPRVEVETIYEGLRELDEAWAQNGDSPVGCGCRRAYWSAKILGRDEDGDLVIEHRCRWCGSTH